MKKSRNIKNLRDFSKNALRRGQKNDLNHTFKIYPL